MANADVTARWEMLEREVAIAGTRAPLHVHARSFFFEKGMGSKELLEAAGDRFSPLERLRVLFEIQCDGHGLNHTTIDDDGTWRGPGLEEARPAILAAAAASDAAGVSDWARGEPYLAHYELESFVY